MFPPTAASANRSTARVPAAEVADFRGKAAGLKKVPVSDADLSSLYRIGDGGLSPLIGPMDQATFDRVLDEEVIIHDGKKYAWTIPIAFPVDEGLAGSLKAGETVALVNGKDEVVGTLDDERRLSLGQGAVPQERLRHRADRPSRAAA